MDGPLYDIKDRHVDDIDISDIDEDDEYYYYKRIDHALGQDNKDVFVQLINSMPSVELDDQLDEIHSSAFFWDAADCVAAALAGETKIPNVYAWLARGTSPMHQAASSAATRITALLLEKGLSADAICDGDPPHSGDVLVLPLCILLSKFSRLLVLHSRRPRPSAVQIIVELCGLKGTLETLRLFAQNSREVKNVLFNSLKEGKVVEVGALLLVARCRLLSSSTAEEESDLGFRSISEMHDFLLHAKRSLCAGGSSTESNFKGKLIEMEETLLLLKIFDKIGDKLATLIRLNFAQTGFDFCENLAVASLIKDAGFDVKADHIYIHRNTLFWNMISKKGIDGCKKMPPTPHVFPSLPKEALFSGLVDGSGSKSRLTHPFFLESLPGMNSVSEPATAPAATSLISGNMPLHHLLKHSFPVLRVIKRASRRG